MMSWQISIPFRDRGDSLAEVADAAREAIPDPEEREVARRLVLAAAQDGHRTAGELIDRIEAASPEQRRIMLDRAREGAGLKRSAAIDAEAIRHPGSGRDAQGRSLQLCHADGCMNYPLDAGGGWAPAAAKKWFCPEHEHLAEPGDLDPPEDLEPDFDWRTMSPRPRREVRERMEQEEREREEKQRERERQAEAEYEAIEAAKERYDEQVVEDVFGLRLHPYSWRIADDR
jgi:hypothetical protein